MPEKTYLTTTYREREQAKALGARWDADARQWYVPTGLDLKPFAQWLPQGVRDEATALEVPSGDDATTQVSTVVKGVPLSRLLSGVASVVASAFSEGIWTTAEVLKVSANKGHVYLELSERNPTTGEVLAQARAVIWARTAQALLADFKRVTGADLDAGIKVMLRAKPVFKAQFGFSLEVDGIDPAYTIGDLEARRREIRERLKRDGLFDRNRRLAAPWDFNAVIVVAPERAAGLGDFAREAERLQTHGVCEFSYVYSRFQGEGAAAEIALAIRASLRTWSGSALPDAIVIIRGGGSVSDLAWLNDYDLAKCICECPVPVLSGIGHERDETSLDEVAHRKFDTPSKVILGIEDVVRARARTSQASFDAVLGVAARAAALAASQSSNLRQEIESGAKAAVAQARAQSQGRLGLVRHGATATLHSARSTIREDMLAVRADSRAVLQEVKKAVPSAMSQVDGRASAGLALARERTLQLMPLVLERASVTTSAARSAATRALQDTLAVSTQVAQARRSMDAMLPEVLERTSFALRHAHQSALRAVLEVAERSNQAVNAAAERSQALFREIAGQGPQKTLRRGFAVVHSTRGPAITSVHALEPGDSVDIDLRDGKLKAVIGTIEPSTGDGT